MLRHIKICFLSGFIIAGCSYQEKNNRVEEKEPNKINPSTPTMEVIKADDNNVSALDSELQNLPLNVLVQVPLDDAGNEIIQNSKLIYTNTEINDENVDDIFKSQSSNILYEFNDDTSTQSSYGYFTPSYYNNDTFNNHDWRSVYYDHTNHMNFGRRYNQPYSNNMNYDNFESNYFRFHNYHNFKSLSFNFSYMNTNRHRSFYLNIGVGSNLCFFVHYNYSPFCNQYRPMFRSQVLNTGWWIYSTPTWYRPSCYNHQHRSCRYHYYSYRKPFYQYERDYFRSYDYRYWNY